MKSRKFGIRRIVRIKFAKREYKPHRKRNHREDDVMQSIR